MHFIGLFLSFLILLPLNLIGTPIVLLILKKGCYHLYTLVILGALTSLVFCKSLALLGSDDPMSLKVLLTGNFYFLLAGGLTGFFLYRQLDKQDFRA